MEVMTYNGQTEPLLCVANMQFEFTRVGLIEPVVNMQTVPVAPYHLDVEAKIFLEGLYTVMLLHLILTEVGSEWRAPHGSQS